MYFQTPKLPDDFVEEPPDAIQSEGDEGDEQGDSHVTKPTNELYDIVEEADRELFSDDGYDTDLDEDKVCPPTPRLPLVEMVMKAYVKECNDIGAIPVTYFQKHVTDNTFEMKYHGLGPLGAKAIAKPLEVNTSIECLNLEGNDIRGEGAEILCKSLRDNMYITVMNLADNCLGSSGALAISEALKKNRILKELDLSANDFRDSDGQCIGNMLLENKSLEKLVLKYNRFECEAVKCLRDALSENEYLRHLDLSWNNIHLKGAVYIAEMVRENYGLKHLDLCMNGLGNTGAAAMGVALKLNQSLQELNVMSNRITVPGVMQLATGLVVNDVLQTVRVGRNPMTPEGAFGILCAIGNNQQCALTLLDLRGVIVKKEFMTLLDKLNSESDRKALEVLHAGLYHQHNIQFSDMDPVNQFENDPMTKLKRYAEKQKLRLVDLFRQFDKDQSWSVSKQEFIQGVKSTGIKMSQEEILKLMATLDKDKDGEIYYKEFMSGDSSNRAQLRQILKEANEQKQKDAETKKKSQLKDFKFNDEQ